MFCSFAGLMTKIKTEQCVNLKFLVKLKKNDVEIYAIEDSHFTENERSKNRHATSEGNNDHYFAIRGVIMI
jgi:hypothetical protein